MEADIIIVGAGIAGLRCGIELLHKRSKASVVILEKYKYLGGRVVTYHKKIEDMDGKCSDVQWENGAGRISKSHTGVMSLIKKYGLHTFDLSREQSYVENGVVEENTFDESLRAILPEIKRLSKETLANHTLREILSMLIGPEKANDFLLQFPYRAEVDVLRADLGITSFEHEMGSEEEYVVVKEGLSALIDGMVEDFKRLGGVIFNKQEVIDVQQEGENVLVKTRTDAGNVLWKAKSVILALHAAAVRSLPALRDWNVLKHLKMEPLLRTYAVFPVSDGTSWFSDVGRVITPGPIRYFIPVNPACGIVMISYTEGVDARRFMRIMNDKGEDALGEHITGLVREMFPQKDIPDPLFFKAHPWDFGCTYWLPGHYDPEAMSKEALHPLKSMPGVYCCGESFSMRQAWMEGALESADLLLSTYFST